MLCVAVTVLVVQAMLAGARVDLGPEAGGAAVVVMLAGLGVGCLSRRRLPALAEGAALALLVPLRGPLCAAVTAVLAPGPTATVIAAGVSLAPLGYVLGGRLAQVGRGSLAWAAAGVCLGELIVLAGGVGWLPGAFTGLAAAIVFALLGSGRGELAAPSPVPWTAWPLGLAFALAVLVLRRGVGAYHEPGVQPDVTTRLALLLPALLVAWPVSVLASGRWSRRIWLALGAATLAWALQADVTLLGIYASPDAHVGLSRGLHSQALRWPFAEEWWVWLRYFTDLAALGLGALIGALRWRALGPWLLGAACGVLLHDLIIDHDITTLATLGEREYLFVGPLTLLMIAAGAAWFAVAPALAGRKGLFGLPLLLLPFALVPPEAQLGMEEVRRIGEPTVEAFQRQVAGDVVVFSTYGPDTSSPEANERYTTTFTGRLPRWSVDQLELLATAEEPDPAEPAVAPPDAAGLDEGVEVEPDHEYDEHGHIVDPDLQGLLKQRRYGVRVGGVTLHGDHPPVGPEGAATRLLRLFAVPGRAGVFGVGAELLASDLVAANLARRLVVGTEVPLGGVPFGVLLAALGMPGFDGEVSGRPTELMQRLAPGSLDSVVVAPGRQEWPGTDALAAVEGLEDLRDLLAPGGRCLAWIDTTGLGERALSARLAAFGEVFGERSAAFVEMRGLDAPFVLLVGWIDDAGRPEADELALPAPDLTGERTRLADFEDLSAILVRDGPGLVALAEAGPVHRAGRPQPAGLWSADGWAAVGPLVDPEAELARVVSGAEASRRPDPELLAGLKSHGDYSYHLARLRTQVVEMLPDIDWDSFDVEGQHYAAAAERQRDDPLLMLAVASLLEPLVVEQDYTRFAQVFQAVEGSAMPSWRLALQEAVVRAAALQPEEAAQARERARRWGAPRGEDGD